MREKLRKIQVSMSIVFVVVPFYQLCTYVDTRFKFFQLVSFFRRPFRLIEQFSA